MYERRICIEILKLLTYYIVELQRNYLLSDFDDFEMCCKPRHVEYLFPIHINGSRS